MKKLAIRIWVEGLLLLVLRFLYLKLAFDPSTGLQTSTLWSLPFLAALLAAAAAEFFLARKSPVGKYAYPASFSPARQTHTVLLLAGGGLLCTGSFFLLPPSFPPISILAAALAAAALAGLFLFAKSARGGSPRVAHLLPLMFFSVAFILAVYLPEEKNPVLGRFFLPVLASTAAAYALYHLAGFLRREGSLRCFSFFANMASILCISTLPDCAGSIGKGMAFLGFALLLTAFLLLRQENPTPENNTLSPKGDSAAP